MANICDNDLTINGSKVEVAKFMANVVVISEGGVEYNYLKNGKTRVLPFGRLQSRDETTIVFDSKWGTPVDNFIEISNLHPELIFTIKYIIPNDEIAGIIVIKNAAILRSEEDLWCSNFAIELFDFEYIQECMMPEACVNTLKLKGPKSDIKNFMNTVVDENILAHQDAAGEEIFLGLVSYRKKKKIVFTSECEAPIDNLIDISKLYPTLNLILFYHILDDEISGVADIQNGGLLEHQEFDSEEVA